ncbi:MAG: threonine/serine exporter ThrE family protein [Candidatus Limimorpha sp.]
MGKRNFEIEKNLAITLDIGEKMLVYGADVARTEDTVSRLCSKLGVRNFEVYCIGSLLQVSVVMPDGETVQQMRRIGSMGNDLSRLEELNDISRKICSDRLDFCEVEEKVRKVEKMEPYHFFFYYLAAAVGAMSFCIFFGGKFIDGLCAACAGVPIMFLDRIINSDNNPLAHVILDAFVGGLIVRLFVYLGFGTHTDLICIGVVMLLTPGVMFGNAIQDFIHADSLAGFAKFVKAILISIMIVIGMGLSMLFFN